MKKVILVLVIVVMFSTPCLGQVQPGDLFSVDGTLWSVCQIGFKLCGFEFTSIMDCDTTLGFYQERHMVTSQVLTLIWEWSVLHGIFFLGTWEGYF